jgi:hypothetical protein
MTRIAPVTVGASPRSPTLVGAACASGCASGSSNPRHEYPHFVAALSLIAALPPGEVVTLLRRRLDRLAEQRAEIRTLLDNTPARGVPGLFLVEEDYRIALLEAESAFVRRFIDQITHPETGCGRPWAAFHGEPFTTEERQQS